jgi:hypothetical protein
MSKLDPYEIDPVHEPTHLLKLLVEEDAIFAGKPWTDVRAYGTIAKALTGIGSTNTTLVVPSGHTETLPAGATTIPANIAFKPLKGCLIEDTAPGSTLTINGPFEAGPYQWIGSNVTVVFGPGAVHEVFPEWWGADPNGNAATNLSAVQAAINSVKPASDTGFYTPMAQVGVVRLMAKFPISAPVSMFSGVALLGRGPDTGLVAPGFAGSELVRLEATGAGVACNNWRIDQMCFEAGSGVASIRSIAAQTLAGEIGTIWDSTDMGVQLIGYTQECIIRKIFVQGAPNQILHIQGNANRVGAVLKEGTGSGSSTDPYVLVDDHTSGSSVENEFGIIVLEQTGSVNKSGVTLSNTIKNRIRMLHFEVTTSDGYMLRVVGGVGNVLEDCVGLTSMRKILVSGTGDLTIDHLFAVSGALALGGYVEVANTARVLIRELETSVGSDVHLLNTHHQVRVERHVNYTLRAAPATGYSAYQNAHYLTAQNLLKNPSLDAGRYGWTFSAIPDVTEEYVASEVGSGLMGHFVWSTASNRQLLQSITVPAAWVGRPLTLTFLTKVVTEGYVFPYLGITGGPLTNSNTGRANFGTGWQMLSITILPQQAGAMDVGFRFQGVSEVYIDEAHLAFGTDGIPNPAVWKSFELGDATHITAAAAPTTGTWRVGSVVWNTAPAAGGTAGWICTTGGSPGTWKTFGAISA